MRTIKEFTNIAHLAPKNSSTSSNSSIKALDSQTGQLKDSLYKRKPSKTSPISLMAKTKIANFSKSVAKML